MKYITAILLIAIGVLLAVGLSRGLDESNKRDAILHTYNGVVSSIAVDGGYMFYNLNRTTVYFTDGSHVTFVGTPQLVVGNQYSIISDGVGNIKSIILQEVK